MFIAQIVSLKSIKKTLKILACGHGTNIHWDMMKLKYVFTFTSHKHKVFPHSAFRVLFHILLVCSPADPNHSLTLNQSYLFLMVHTLLTDILKDYKVRSILLITVPIVLGQSTPEWWLIHIKVLLIYVLWVISISKFIYFANCMQNWTGLSTFLMVSSAIKTELPIEIKSFDGHNILM